MGTTLHVGFIEALKRSLKSKGITYKMLAERMDISEASVKRVFSQGTLTLERTAQILEAADLSFLDIARSMEAPDAVPQTLSFEQESVLVAEPRLLQLFHLLLFGKSEKAIAKDYYPAEKDLLRKHFRLLEDLALVASGKDGWRLLVAKGVRWMEAGPLMKRYGTAIQKEFLAGPFAKDEDVYTFRTRSMSQAARVQVKRKIEKVLAEIDELAAVETAGSSADLATFSLFFAARPFQFSLMRAADEKKSGRI